MQKLISGNRQNSRQNSVSPEVLFPFSLATPRGPIPPLNLRNPLEIKREKRKGRKGLLVRVFRPKEGRRKEGRREKLHENGFQFVSRSVGSRVGRSVESRRGRVPTGQKSGLGNWTVFSRAAMLSMERSPQRKEWKIPPET